MIKIKFKNGASGKTPLNATNLNKMQDNIEEATMINRIILQGNSIQEGTPSIDSEAPIESVGDNINYLPYPFTNTTKNENGITFTDNEDGTINIKGTATKDTFFYLYSGNISTFASIAKINNKKVVLMELSGSLSSSSLEISLYNADNSGKSTYLNNGTISNAITINNQSQNINSAIVVKSGATVNTTLKPMLVLEKESTGAYSPYGQGSIGITLGNGTTSQTKALYTQQPFRAIGDVKDRFVKQNGVWYEEHSIKRCIFTGEENWLYYGDSRWKFRIQIKQILPFTNEQTETPETILSNCFSSTNWEDKENSGKFTGMKNGNTILSFGYEGVSLLEGWETLLLELYNAGTPVYVDYVLAEPLLIPCTPEQVEILNDIYSTYGKGLTNITCTDEVAPVIEIVKETKETVQSENDKAISYLLARIEELEKKVK